MVCSSKSNLEAVYVGDDIYLNLGFKEKNWDIIDLTGSTLTLTIKENKSDVVPAYQEIQTDVEMVDPVGGITQFHVDGDVTKLWNAGTYHYDIVWDTSSGSHSTIIIGDIPVMLPVHTDI